MSLPYEYDAGDEQIAMDKRHVYLLHDILCAGHFRSALEIGCAYGASTTAFVMAMRAIPEMRVTLCDIFISESVKQLTKDCGERLTILQTPSVEVLESPREFDFILVDACHDMKSVAAEVDRLIPRKPLCLMAHDTSATLAGYPESEGAEYLKRRFMLEPGYLCLEDNLTRESEATERGLFFATTSEALFSVAQQRFSKWCAEWKEVEVAA